MAVVSVEEILKRLGEALETDDAALALMEDVSDTLKAIESPQVDWESDDNPHKKRAEELALRYKERFYGKEDANQTEIFDEEDVADVEELLRKKED